MEIKKLIVHGGIFHSDDVMCAAIAKMVNPDVEIERVFRVPEDIEHGTIVADIGGGKYDHHQTDCETRESGEKYAACGLLLRDVWQQVFPDEQSYREFEEDFIIPIELADNGVVGNPYSRNIKSYIPAWNSEKSMDDAFMEAVNEARGTLEREVEYARSKVLAKDIVDKAFEESDGKTVVLSQYVPWQDILCDTTAQYVIFPSNRGGYNMQVVPVSQGSFEAKTSLPEEWLENRPDGCSFVHSARFIAAFDTLEDALNAVPDEPVIDEQNTDDFEI